MNEKAKHPIRSDVTLLRIIEGLEEYENPSVTKLAEAIGVSKSTVHNHLSTLREHGYVINDDGRYRLGLRFLQLGECARTYTEFYEVARPQVDVLARETGHLVNVAVEERGRGVYLYRKRGDEQMRLSTKAGERHDLHCTATGKAILAHLLPDRVHAILSAHGLPKNTDNTITDQDELLTQLEEIRDRGVAFDDEEYGQGLRCIGVPVIDEDGTPLGAISISGPAMELTGDTFQSELPKMLRSVSNRIELNLRNY